MTVAAIPSPTTSVWHLLGIPIRAYAICIVLGIIAACYLLEQRMRSRGAAPWASLDIAVWAVPCGIVGARIYHLITSPQDYFGSGGDPIRAFYIWEGGLGIWGAVAGGALGAFIAARQLRIPFGLVADSLAVGLPVAQAIGRFGNWFNNELYGGPTTLPWGLRVHDMDQNNPGHSTMIDGKAVTLPGLYHPTFLYEAIWDIGTAILVWQLDKRKKFGRGRAFALYVMAYTAGRFWIEMLRTDPANHFFGIRLNVFTAAVVFIGALFYFIVIRGTRQYVVPIDAPTSAAETVAESDVSQVDVTAAPAGDRNNPPRAYQLVSEARFEEYQRTGVLPPDTPADVAEEVLEGASPSPDALVSTGAVVSSGAAGSSDAAAGGSPDVAASSDASASSDAPASPDAPASASSDAAAEPAAASSVAPTSAPPSSSDEH